jgi:hypothetical protein
MRLMVQYKNGGAFEVEADDTDEFELVLNTALQIMWGDKAEAMTLDDMAKWLGWDEERFGA